MQKGPFWQWLGLLDFPFFTGPFFTKAVFHGCICSVKNRIFTGLGSVKNGNSAREKRREKREIRPSKPLPKSGVKNDREEFK